MSRNFKGTPSMFFPQFHLNFIYEYVWCESIFKNVVYTLAAALRLYLDSFGGSFRSSVPASSWSANKKAPLEKVSLT